MGAYDEALAKSLETGDGKALERFLYIDLEKAHIKAHFRLNPKTGKREFIKDYDDSRHKDEVDISFRKGDKVRIDHPKSKHHGKELVVTSYSEKYGISGKVEGEKYAVEMHPDRLSHLDVTPKGTLGVKDDKASTTVVPDKEAKAPTPEDTSKKPPEKDDPILTTPKTLDEAVEGLKQLDFTSPEMQHEKHRIETMSVLLLEKRISKIRSPQKLYNFLRAADYWMSSFGRDRLVPKIEAAIIDRAGRSSIPKVAPKAEPVASFLGAAQPKTVALTEAQKKAVDYIHNIGVITEADFKYFSEFTKGVISVDLLKKFADKWAKDLESGALPICVNRAMEHEHSRSFKSVLTHGKFKNQFELRGHATSGGSCDPHKEGCRDDWERHNYDGIYHTGPEYDSVSSGDYLPKSVAEQRPAYGYINDPDYPFLRGGYGKVTFILHPDLVPRATFTTTNSSGTRGRKETNFTAKNCYGVFYSVLRCGDSTWVREAGTHEKVKGDMEAYVAGTRDFSGFSRAHYYESQYHGGVDLTRGDVKEIHIPKTGYDHIKQLAEKYSIPLKYK